MAKKKVTRNKVSDSRKNIVNKNLKPKTNPPTALIKNNLGDGLGLGFPFNQGVPGTEQLSNTQTLFKNLRYYYVSNFRQLLSQMYAEIGLVQTIVDVPVDDAFRGGVEIKSKELDEAEIVELQNALERDNDYENASEAMKWNRLFGGAAIIVLTDQDSDTELDIELLGPDDPLEFKAADMWELYSDRQNMDMDDANMTLMLKGKQDVERLPEDDEFYFYYGIKVHSSRVFLIKGIRAPSFIRPRLRGWGLSVVEKLVRSLNQYLKTSDLTFEVLDEFKLDIYKIKNLTNSLLAPDTATQIYKRVEASNYQKNYQNAIVMDAEDDYDHKQLSFTGLAEVMAGNRMQVASDMRMPLTKIFGISAAGFNSGEDDIEVYNSMVESDVRAKIKFPLLKMIEMKCQKLFGFIPDDLSIGFKPLRILTSDQEEVVKTQKFTRALQAKQAGEMTRFEFRETCNKAELFPITLDNTGDSINPDDPDVATLIKGGPEEKEEGEINATPSTSPFKTHVKKPPQPKLPNSKTNKEKTL